MFFFPVMRKRRSWYRSRSQGIILIPQQLYNGCTEHLVGSACDMMASWWPLLNVNLSTRFDDQFLLFSFFILPVYCLQKNIILLLWLIVFLQTILINSKHMLYVRHIQIISQMCVLCSRKTWLRIDHLPNIRKKKRLHGHRKPFSCINRKYRWKPKLFQFWRIYSQFTGRNRPHIYPICTQKR